MSGNISVIIEDAIERLRLTIKERDIHIRSVVGSGSAEVWADGRRVDVCSRPQDADASIRKLLGIADRDAELVRELAAIVGG